jgi:hypothetical protein
LSSSHTPKTIQSTNPPRSLLTRKGVGHRSPRTRTPGRRAATAWIATARRRTILSSSHTPKTIQSTNPPRVLLEWKKGEDAPPRPPLCRSVNTFLIGKVHFCTWKGFLGPLLVHKPSDPRPPPHPLSNASLLPRDRKADPLQPPQSPPSTGPPTRTSPTMWDPASAQQRLPCDSKPSVFVGTGPVVRMSSGVLRVKWDSAPSEGLIVFSEVSISASIVCAVNSTNRAHQQMWVPADGFLPPSLARRLLHHFPPGDIYKALKTYSVTSTNDRATQWL